MSLLHAQDAELLLRSPEMSLPPSAAFLGDALEWISMFIKAWIIEEHSGILVFHLYKSMSRGLQSTFAVLWLIKTGQPYQVHVENNLPHSGSKQRQAFRGDLESAKKDEGSCRPGLLSFTWEIFKGRAEWEDRMMGPRSPSPESIRTGILFLLQLTAPPPLKPQVKINELKISVKANTHEC